MRGKVAHEFYFAHFTTRQNLTSVPMDLIFPFDHEGIQLSLNGFYTEPLFTDNADGMCSPQSFSPDEPVLNLTIPLPSE